MTVELPTSATLPPSAPPPAPPARPVFLTQTDPAAAALAARKSRVTAAALALILGSLGAHKFYMGKVGQGVLYLVFCWAYIPGILGWIEAMRYLSKSDEAWASEHSWPIQRSNGAAIAVLWVLALLPMLSIVAIVALIFLGGQVSST